MNPPMDPAETSRIDDLVQRVNRLERESKEDRERLYRAIERAVQGVGSSIDRLDERMTERMDGHAEALDELRDSSARRKDIALFAGPVAVAVIAFIGSLLTTGGINP